MRTRYARILVAVVIWGLLCLPAMEASARLPKPVHAGGMVMALDFDTHTMAFRQNPNGNLLLLDWDRKTKFMVAGKPVPAVDLAPGTEVTVAYRYVSFHKPMLVEVGWVGKK